MSADLTSVGSQPRTALDPSAVFLVLMNDAMADSPQLQPHTQMAAVPAPAKAPSGGHRLDTYA